MLLALALTAPTHAAPNGYPTCPAGQTVKIVNETIQVPHRFVNAQRGDVVLTSGGAGIPRAILSNIGQNYNHALFVSEADDGYGSTTFSHMTAIPIGRESVSWYGRVDPDKLRRTSDGNRFGDSLGLLLNGHYTRCNEYHDMAYCMQQDTTDRNMWRGDTVLLRPNPAWFGTIDPADIMESEQEQTRPYAVGAFSKLDEVLWGTGTEAGYGIGGMCSGVVQQKLNAALSLAMSTHSIPERVYQEPERIAAAYALYHSLRDRDMPKWTSNQVVNCFVNGGQCRDWPTEAKDEPGTGRTVSPDDLLNSWEPGFDWYDSVRVAQFAGGWSYDRFSHYACCDASGTQCVRVEDPVPNTPLTDVFVMTADLSDPATSPPPGYTPTEVEAGRAHAEWVDFVAGSPGSFVESDTELCWVADGEVGRLCTSLVDLQVEPEPPTDVDTAEQRRAWRQLERTDPTLTEGEPEPGDTLRRAATAEGAKRPADRLSLELAAPETICLDSSFVASASAEGATRIAIDGATSEQVAITASYVGPQTVSALAFFEDGSSEVHNRTFEVVRCDRPALRTSVARSTTRDDLLRFRVRRDRGANEAPPAGTLWIWDFGDGTIIETTEPVATHDYALRDQASASSSYLVTIEEHRRDGQIRTAYTNATFVNARRLARDSAADPHWEFPATHPRRPRWTGDALVLPLELRNLDEAAAFEIQDVELRTTYCSGEAQVEAWPTDVLSTTVVEPGAIARVRARLEVPWSEERVCSYQLSLQGRAGEVRATTEVVYDLDARPAAQLPVTRATAARRLERIVAKAQAERLDAGDSEPGEPSEPGVPTTPDVPTTPFEPAPTLPGGDAGLAD